MSTEGYAEFLKDMGHTVRATAGVFWYNDFPHFYTCFPFHRIVDTQAVDVKGVLGNDGWAMRYPCAFHQGRKSYRLACAVQNYGLQSLSGKARNQTRRGLEQCHVRPLLFAELEVHGIPLNRETLVRQGRRIPNGFEDYWRRYYRAAARADGACSWGAFVGDRLGAYLIAFDMERVMHVLIVRSSTEHLKSYPNNALLFEFLRFSLNQGGCLEVSIGLESIRKDLTSLDHFKEGMGFSQVEIGQRVELAPRLALLFRPAVCRVILWAAPAWKHGEKLDKLAGLLDWYRDQPCR